jgi:hypothetical protein
MKEISFDHVKYVRATIDILAWSELESNTERAEAEFIVHPISENLGKSQCRVSTIID